MLRDAQAQAQAQAQDLNQTKSMSSSPSFKLVTVSLAVVGAAIAQTLNPAQDIVLPSSASAASPLQWLGAGSPWFAGPNVHGISSDVPEGCTIDQAAYVVRHGSRYPDQGAYNGWVTLYQKIQAAQFEATGSLSFLKSWKPVLTNPALQIAQESITGYKESHDLGYALRTRYPQLYTEGARFTAWANLYPRVVQTARMFVRGYLGPNSDKLGSVITVNSTGSPEALGNSLAPSDLCPAFADGNGGTYATTWDSIYLPPITTRLNALLVGNLTFTDSDVSGFPYMCGFESQIVGELSPWCGVFTDDELKDYEYRQDLRYWYGTGPGTTLPKTMMLPFLNSLVELLGEGPGVTGKNADGSNFTLPDLIMAFANDGQITELAAAVGVFDDQIPLSGTKRLADADWKYIASYFVNMRGTVAFERLNCKASGNFPSSSISSRTLSSAPTSTIKAASCNRDNCLRQFLKETAVAPFCATYTTTINNATTNLPTYVSQCANSPSRISSACSCIVTASSTSSSIKTPASSAINNKTYIRILLNDAPYPITSCQDGPGRSCLLSTYVDLVKDKYEKSGDWVQNCNVTKPGSPAVVQGAGFLKDLRLGWLGSVVP